MIIFSSSVKRETKKYWCIHIASRPVLLRSNGFEIALILVLMRHVKQASLLYRALAKGKGTLSVAFDLPLSSNAARSSNGLRYPLVVAEQRRLARDRLLVGLTLVERVARTARVAVTLMLG